MKGVSAPPPPAPLPVAAENRWLNPRVLAVAGGVFCLGLLLVLHQFDPARSGFYPRCTFHQVTGLNCPGCGGLRATHHLLHGHAAAALRHNALVVLAVPVLAAWAGHWLWRRWRGIPPRLAAPSTVWWWGMLGALLLFSVLRNLPFAPFTALSP